MKRVISLDFMRGISMMLMIALHVFFHVLHFDTSDINNIPLAVKIVGGLMFLFGNFRAFFLIISMIVNMISMQNNLQRGKSPWRVWGKQLFTGFMLIIIGMIGQAIFAAQGVFGFTYQYAGPSIFHPDWDFTFQAAGINRYTRLNYVETVHTIGWSILLTSTIHLVLVLIRNGKDKTNRNAIVYAIIGILVLVFTPFLLIAVETYWGAPFVYWFNGQYQFLGWKTWEGWKDGLLRILCATAVGEIEPLFPFFASACVGSILGLYLSKSNATKKLPNRGMIASGILILIGLGLFLRDTSQFMELINRQIFIHPAWFFLIITGLELFVICLILRIKEFNHRTDMQKYAKRTTFFRRWGLIALTLFTFQIWPEFLLRDIFTWATGIDYHTLRQTSLSATLLMVVVVVFFWDILLRIWERGNFVGSLEWLMSLVSVPLIKGKLRSGRMQIKKILYHPEAMTYDIFKPNPSD